MQASSLLFSFTLDWKERPAPSRLECTTQPFPEERLAKTYNHQSRAFAVGPAAAQETASGETSQAGVASEEHRQFIIPMTCTGNTCTYTSPQTKESERRVLERVNCRYAALVLGVVSFTTGDLTVLTGT